MDFLRRQEAARRQTRLLVFLFVLAVAATAFTLDLLGAGIWIWIARARAERAGLPVPPFSVPLDVHLWASGVSLAVILGATVYKLLQLARRGGAKVAELAGGRRLTTDAPADAPERQLQNVVDEMSIASGARRPELWVLDRDPSINAFAAGYDPESAVLAVTRGALALPRDELQGVVAHEISHILSGDTRLNMRLLTVVFGLLAISTIGRALRRLARGLVRLAPGGDGEAGGLQKAALVVAILPWLLGAAVSLVGATGVLFGRLVRAAVSRQREFLGDAAAVQFTRNPDGIGRALERASAAPPGPRTAYLTSSSEALSHFFFVAPGGSRWWNWLGTHPRPKIRLRRIYGRDV